ncbi:hypothetical protein V5T82_10975 [Magnetovibrio sp. PR-2]|uniref:hypothetical protein n=1 Tax=Magnetovibrio sp. PR-2 TaxID=3120356 RepID=UPI002FCDE2D1
MGSDSASDAGSGFGDEVPPEVKEQEAERKAQEYRDQLSKAKGWDRFALGTKMGYMNYTSTKGPKSGDWDEARGRTLGYNDFLPGGLYGPTKGEKKGAVVDYGARRDSWNAQNPTVSDERVARARAANLDRAFNQGHMQTLDNGLTVERQSSALSSPMTAASASVVGKLSQITAEPEAPVKDVDVMGNSVNKGSSIAQTQMGSLAQSGKPGPNAAKSPAAGTLAYTDDPTKAPIASPYTMSQADIDKMQAAKAKVETDRVKAEEKKQKEEEAVMKGMFSQIAAAQDKARKSKEFHPAYGLTDQSRETEIAKEHHPAYGYTQTGDGLLADLKSDIKGQFSVQKGFSNRGEQLANLYNSLPETMGLSSRNNLLSSKQGRQATLTSSVGMNGVNNFVDVLQTQKALVDTGYLSEEYVTGYPGTAMVDAIKSWQRDLGAYPSGLLSVSNLVEATPSLSWHDPEATSQLSWQNPSARYNVPHVKGLNNIYAGFLTPEQLEAIQELEDKVAPDTLKGKDGKSVDVAFLAAAAPAIPAAVEFLGWLAGAWGLSWAANEASKQIQADPSMNPPLPGFEPTPEFDKKYEEYIQNRLKDLTLVPPSNPEPPLDHGLLENIPGQIDIPTVVEARKNDLRQVDHLANRHDLDRRKAGKVLEQLKSKVGMKGESADIDIDTGEVYDPISGESLGNIIDEMQ